MTNANRPLPSVELAKLNQMTMRRIQMMQREIETLAEVEHHLEDLFQEKTAELAKSHELGSLHEAIGRLKASCATAQAAFSKLKIELSK